MIKVSFSQKKVIISGHANYDNYGSDIVCASVSSIVYTTINAILSFNKDAIKVSDKVDLIIDIISDDEITLKLLQNMFVLLKEVAKQYPKNIKVKEN